LNDIVISVELAFSAAFAVVSFYIAISNVLKVCALAKERSRPLLAKIGFALFLVGMLLFPYAHLVGIEHVSFGFIVLGLAFIAVNLRVDRKENRKIFAIQAILSIPFYDKTTLFHALYTVLLVYILNAIREKSLFKDWAVENYYKASTWLFVLGHVALLLVTIFTNYEDLLLSLSLIHITSWILVLYPSLVIYGYMRRWL